MLLMQHIDKRHMYVDSVLLVLKTVTVLLLWSPLDLVVLASVEHEFVGVSWRHTAVAFGPIV
jgi:hypothetical protein